MSYFSMLTNYLGPSSCAAFLENGREWPVALDGQIALQRCRDGYQGDMYRRCQNGIYLNLVNNCTRRAIQDLHAQVLNGFLNTTEALSRLKQETTILTTANENLLTAGDLQNIIQILDKVIKDIEVNSATIVNDTDNGVGADSVINTIDRFISKVVNSSHENWNKTFDKPNMCR
ncbi:hypothetical protein MAR_016968, partial [Mya arenaria]